MSDDWDAVHFMVRALLARASNRARDLDALLAAPQGIDLLAHAASSGGAVLVDVTTLLPLQWLRDEAAPRARVVAGRGQVCSVCGRFALSAL